MRRPSLYGHVVEVLDEIRRSPRPADTVVQSFLKDRRYIGSHDRRFITETVYGVIRHFTLLEHRLAAVALGGAETRGPVPSVLLCVAHELVIRGEDPEPLSRDIADLMRMAGSEPDCLPLLQRIAGSDLPEMADPVRSIAIRTSMPEPVVREWVETLGGSEAEQLCLALNQPAAVVIRCNGLKVAREECIRRLAEEGIPAAPTRYSPEGLVLQKRLNTQASPAFQMGMYEVQDEGSQLVSHLVSPAPGSLVIDACAGAGGKTLHLAALMQNRGRVIALDVEPVRLKTLLERAERAGVTIVETYATEGDLGFTEDLTGRADAVLVDAPCSGVGTFRRSPWAKRTFDPAVAQNLSVVQRSLLRRSAPLVKVGGVLVYATCTLLRRENEDTVEEFLSAHPDFALLHIDTVLPGPPELREGPYMKLYTHRTGTDGFFGAVMRRLR